MALCLAENKKAKTFEKVHLGADMKELSLFTKKIYTIKEHARARTS